MSHINISISEELHKNAKSKAALQGITLKKFIINLIEKGVQDEEDSIN